MSEFLYSVVLRLYSIAIRVASPFYPKAKLLRQGRQAVWQQLSSFNPECRPVLWFHCASLGEFEQGRPVIEACKSQFPQHAILLTFFSPSGYEIRKNYPQADLVTYLPADSAHNARKFCQLVQPTVAIFVKYEFWHFYTLYLKKQGVHLLSISAIFRENHRIFKPSGQFLRRVVARFNHLFVQNNASQERLVRAGISQASVAGDTRFDRVVEIAQNRQRIELAEQFAAESFTVVMGSVWHHDLEIVAQVLDAFPHPLRLIIAPHEIDEPSLQRTEAFFTRKEIQRYSQYNPNTSAEILLVDNIGMLSSLYQYGQIAYVGGAFGKGLHNVLEASVYGIPVIFGAKYEKFQEAVELIEEKAAFSMATPEAFAQIFTKLYQQRDFRKEAGARAAAYVQQRQGATKIILQHLRQQLT